MELEQKKHKVIKKIESLDMTISSLMEVLKNPNYKEYGFSAEIRDNGTIVLKAGNLTEHHTHSLSKSDSNHIHNIIRMNAEEKMAELKKELNAF